MTLLRPLKMGSGRSCLCFVIPCGASSSREKVELMDLSFPASKYLLSSWSWHPVCDSQPSLAQSLCQRFFLTSSAVGPGRKLQLQTSWFLCVFGSGCAAGKCMNQVCRHLRPAVPWWELAWDGLCRQPLPTLESAVVTQTLAPAVWHGTCPRAGWAGEETAACSDTSGETLPLGRPF